MSIPSGRLCGVDAGGRLCGVQPPLRARPQGRPNHRGSLLGSRAAQVLRPRSDQQGADRKRSSCAHRCAVRHRARDQRPGAAAAPAACTEHSRPLVIGLEAWLREQRARVSKNSDTGKAIDYSLKRWAALTRFLDDGRLCMTNNAAERELRAVAVGRRNWTFAGSDQGGRRAAALYTLIATALCRARHKAVYADCRTMPNGFGKNPSFARIGGWSSDRRPSSIRHSLAFYSASRKASRRSLGWKRVRLRCSYGLSFARAASLSARWACR